MREDDGVGYHELPGLAELSPHRFDRHRGPIPLVEDVGDRRGTAGLYLPAGPGVVRGRAQRTCCHVHGVARQVSDHVPHPPLWTAGNLTVELLLAPRLDENRREDGAMRHRDIEAEVRATLDRLGVPYEVIACDPAYADTAAFCERYGYSPEISANAILVASKTEPRRYVCCVVLAPTRLDVNRTVRTRMGVKKASFARPEETETVTGMAIGGVTPLALPDDIPIWVDPRVMGCEEIILGGGSRSMKVKTTPEVFTRLPNAEVVEGLAT